MKEKEALCKLGQDRYELNLMTTQSDYWDSILSNDVNSLNVILNSLGTTNSMISFEYVVANIGYNAKMNKEQVEFLLNADKALWGAFSGKNFVKFSRACVDATKDLPVDIWDNSKVSEWKDLQKKLRNNIKICLNSKFGMKENLENQRPLGKFSS